MQAEIAIYEPPRDGLPYLVVTVLPDGVNVVTAKSRTEARTIVSERAIARRRARKVRPAAAPPIQPATTKW